MSTLADRIKLEARAAGLTQAALAERANVSQALIHKLTSGKAAETRKAGQIAKALGVTTDWLLTGKGPKTDLEIVAKHGITPPTHGTTHDANVVSQGIASEYLPRLVPLISATTAGHWAEAVDHFQPGDAERWIEVPAGMGEHSFALRIRGDSMEPTIRDGWIVVVDPDCPAEHGKIVVVRQNSDTEATCKRLIYDGSKPYLRPDNDRYPLMEMREDAVICGVVRRAQVDFD